MARKIGKKDNRYLAKLVTGERKPCAFCLREVDDEVIYGKLYEIGDIQCHYFCCLLSCCLIQKGHDEEGLFGFMYPDIIAEVERCKKHKCSYCSRNGANLGCSVGACRKQFHLPCGREKNAISLYYGTYKSFCQHHAPKQKIPEHIMAKAKLRLRADRMRLKYGVESAKIAAITNRDTEVDKGVATIEEMVCVICYEAVDGFPTIHTFWPPCCAKDAWFHRSCLQRMALSAGMHYLKCPLCNDKESFYDAVVSQGYYVPDRDAAWELEQNAFAEIYERPLTCCADQCSCPNGREHDAENGQWDIKLCLLCGSSGIHAQCFADQSQQSTVNVDQSQPSTENDNQSQSSTVNADQSQPLSNLDSSLKQIQKAIDDGALSLNRSESEVSVEQSQKDTETGKLDNQSQVSTENVGQSQPLTNESAAPMDQSQAFSLRYVCRSCMPAAPEDLSALASRIEAIIQQEPTETPTNTLRPVMPSRMSLRRTKGRLAILNRPSSSRSHNPKTVIESTESANVRSSRLELNLKTPRKPSYGETAIIRDTDNIILSPLKLLQQSFKEKMQYTGVRDAVLDESIIETLRRKFRKPRPMCEKKRIVDNILDGIFLKLMKETPKPKVQVREWCSPKKSLNTTEECLERETEIAEINTPETNQDKENDSNTFNTPVKGFITLKYDSVITDNNIRIEEAEEIPSSKDLRECYRKTRHSISKRSEETDDRHAKEDPKLNKYFDSKVYNSDEKSNKINEDQKKAKNSLSKVINEEIENEGIKDGCRKTNSTANVDTESQDVETLRSDHEKYRTGEARDSQIEKTPIKASNLNCRKTRGSLSLLFTNKSSSITANHSPTDQIIKVSNIEEIPSIEIGENTRKSTKSISKISSDSGLENTNSNIDLDSSNNVDNTHEYKHKLVCPKKPLSLSKIKNRNSSKNTPKKSREEFTRDHTYSKMIEDSKQHGEFLRKLLTEEDLCAQLLSELTRNQNNIEMDEAWRKPVELSEHLMETSINLIEASDSMLNNSNASDSPSNISKDTIISSQNSSTEIQNNMTQSPNIIGDNPKCKTIDIQQDSSLEISEKDQSINIDMIKIDDTTSNTEAYKNFNINIQDKSQTCAFKFSPVNKETLKKNTVGIDLESFKKEYLSEVDREFKCNFKHKHVEKQPDNLKIRSVIDFAIDAVFKKELGITDESEKVTRKRKLSESGVRLVYDDNIVKRRKTSESDLKLNNDLEKKEADIINLDNNRCIDEEIEKIREDNSSAKEDVKKKRDRRSVKDKRKLNKAKERRKSKKSKRKSTKNKNIEVTIDSSENRSGSNRKIKKKIKTKFAIRNDNIHVRIKWKKKQLSLNIESKKQAKKVRKEKVLPNSPKLKQYVLQFPEGLSKEVLVRPEKEVCPIKRKYVRNEKIQDNLKQMSIQSFFKVKPQED